MIRCRRFQARNVLSRQPQKLERMSGKRKSIYTRLISRASCTRQVYCRLFKALGLVFMDLLLALTNNSIDFKISEERDQIAQQHEHSNESK